ncbi:uncharacterized protein TNCV_748921 [Trichonephila clavipes]|nr:uncharacterized protein TNCV_748921 [Trichonephila clavipes]
MMNSSESAKRPSGKRPKKRKFTGCDSWKRRKGSPAYKKWKILHVKECLKNHNGSAGMMETVGIIRIFQRSLSHRSVRYTSYIKDGDSKTFSSITASNPYGEDITV